MSRATAIPVWAGILRPSLDNRRGLGAPFLLQIASVTTSLINKEVEEGIRVGCQSARPLS
jgi:hypothetical protein